MQLTFVPTTDNYQVMIQILSGLVKSYLCKPSKRYALARVDELTFQAVTELLESEDDVTAELELAIEWLTTHKQAA
ncbi:hypothetical protein [Paenibacillus sp. YN15]|uniref:hypothetical protein n=1 Tax=Paenibacillus sp. YN15 TaxID=1742774 RepID=UPI000DCE4A05|nr:hypothetical protein [Paenibacillus sp. YN15]RAV00164.1 hypothetical protein DQG13_14510 [Paenibacillus sp. YN15]